VCDRPVDDGDATEIERVIDLLRSMTIADIRLLVAEIETELERGGGTEED
jgi:hypothetical protein